ncbi:MAG: hypothetical protein ABSB18_08165 [Candidatus Omnitrophota bacterium]
MLPRSPLKNKLKSLRLQAIYIVLLVSLLPAIGLPEEKKPAVTSKNAREESIEATLAEATPQRSAPEYGFVSGTKLQVASWTEEKEYTFKSDSYFQYTPAESAEVTSGKVGLMKAASEYEYTYKVGGKLPVKLSVGSGYIGISNTTPVELPAHLVAVTTDIETTFPFFNANNTYLRLGVSPSFYGDDWSLPTSSFRIPFRSYLIYMPNEKWTYILGVAVYPDFKYNVLPIVGFVYKPNKRLVFNIVPTRPNITYALTEKLAIFGETGAALDNEFEVTKDNLKNVILRYNEKYVGMGLQYDLNKYIRASFSTGFAFNRRLTYDDELGKVQVKDAIYSQIRIQIVI